MLKNVDIINFKSWRKLFLDLSEITAFFGPNSSGKSSLLQFLLLLKQTKENVDRSLALDFGNAKTYINLGSFHDAIYDHKDDEYISWNLKWNLSEKLIINDPTAARNIVMFEGSDMAISAEVGIRNQLIRTESLCYEFSGQKFSLNRKEKRPSAYSIDTSGSNKNFRFIRNQGRVWDIPGPVKSYSFPEQVKTYHQNADFLSDLELSYERLMDRIYYLGPLREYPKREYTWSGASPTDVGPRGERVVDALLAARSRNEKRSLGYKKKKQPFDVIIAYWLKELGLIHEFSVEEIAEHSNLYKVKVQRDSSSTPVLITDVGFGVSQFLPVLVLLYYVPEGSIVLLEQPEIHLHPAVQSGLADLIINVSQTRNIQVVVESHSEHLLRRLQLRIAEEKILSDNVSIYFCETKRGESKLSTIDINLFGEIENWPPNFFGDEFGEITAIQKAALSRRLQNTK